MINSNVRRKPAAFGHRRRYQQGGRPMWQLILGVIGTGLLGVVINVSSELLLSSLRRRRGRR